MIPDLVFVRPPAFRTETNRPNDANVKEEITILKQIATDRSLTTIDAHAPLVNFSKCFTDGIHPNQAGYDSIAHAYHRVIMTTAIDNAVAQTVTPAPSGVKSPTRGFSTRAFFIGVGEKYGPLSIVFGKGFRRKRGLMQPSSIYYGSSVHGLLSVCPKTPQTAH